KAPRLCYIGEREVVVSSEGVVGEPIFFEFCDDLQQAHLLSLSNLGFNTFRRLEFGEVVIGEVTLESVRNENIRDTVNVEVFYQYTPAPVGIGHSGELADLAECAVSIVQVKHIAHILRMQTASNHGIKHVE